MSGSVENTAECMEQLEVTEVTKTLRLDEVIELLDKFIVEKQLDPRNMGGLINIAYEINGGITLGELLGYRNPMGIPMGVNPEKLLYDEQLIHKMLIDGGKQIDEARKKQASQEKQPTKEEKNSRGKHNKKR
jgi:hypothetical protein